MVSAPVVNSQLGNSFIVEGLKDIPDEDLDLMIWQIQGKSDDEIAKLLRQRKQLELVPPAPHRPEPVYYTDKEYQALKKEREKVGIHYLDQLPTKEELDQRLKPVTTTERSEMA